MSTDPTPPAEPPRVKARLPFEKPAMSLGGGGGVQKVAVVVYAALVVALVGLTIYMGAVQRLPLTSAYVVAPAIGAAWFALRLFMMMTPKG